MPGRWMVPVLAAVILAATACSTGPATPDRAGSAGSGRPSPDPTGSPAGSPTGSRPTPPTVEATETAGQAITPIRITVGDQSFAAELYDNPTARDLADQLPLTLTVDDLHGLEKTGRLPRALTTRGVPAGSDPEVDEIGYYAPGRNLVLYYGDVGYYTGIVRIGRFADAIAAIADQPDGVSVTVERA